MIKCEGCGRSFNAKVSPLYCSCEHVTKFVATEVPSPPMKTNAWAIIHSRYAAAIQSGQWEKGEECRWLGDDFHKLIPCGTCGGKWLEIRGQLDLASAESAFFSCWRLHNIVSTEHVKPANPAYTYEQARFLYLNEQPKRDRCIVTVATGSKFREILLIARPSLIAYAEKCNADYYEVLDTTCNDWRLEKFRVHKYAKAYERTLYLDADTIIKRSCPDMFQEFETGNVWMHDDYPLLETYSYLESQRKDFFKAYGVEDENPNRCFNSGVVLCDRSTADVWKPPTFELPAGHFGEQLLVEQQAANLKNLPTAFNTQFWMTDFAARESNILHLASCKTKATEMQKWVNEIP